MQEFPPFKLGDIFLAKRVLVINHRFPQRYWYEELSIPAGKYPIYATEVYLPTMEVVYYTSYIAFTGTVEEDYFPPLLFGMQVGKYNTAKNRGAMSHFELGLPTYTFANAVFYNEGRIDWLNTHMTVRLDTEYTPIRLNYWEGTEQKEVTGIVRRPQ